METLTPGRRAAAPLRTTQLRVSRALPKLLHSLRRVELLVALAISLVAVALHLRFVTTVGGLWRDETNSVNLANLSSLSEVWHFLDYDSFPIFFFTVLRGWTAVWGIENDTALRALGCITGLSILAVIWLNALTITGRPPVLAMALVGLNPMVIRYGDSTRAYGLGILLLLLTFRSFWRLVDPSVELTGRRVVVATVFALLSVQCLYYNSVLLFAIAVGAVAVAWSNDSWKRLGTVLGIGVIAATSMLPYVAMMRRMRAWTYMVSYPADYRWLWKRLSEVIGSPASIAVWIWTALFLGAVALVILAVSQSGSQPQAQTRFFRERVRSVAPAGVFAAVAAIIGLIAYATFLNVLNYYTQPWYYITLVAFVACALDLVFGAAIVPARASLDLAMRGLRLATAIALLALSGVPAWDELPTRHTNLDFVAKKISSLSTAGDVILVPRWECAIPICRYYHGPADVMCLPPIEDHRFHRYDLVVQESANPNAIQPVIKRLDEALRFGHRVFVVGGLPYPTADLPAPPSRPPYRDLNGVWRAASHEDEWHFTVGQFLRAHATGVQTVMVELPAGTEVQDFEHLHLALLEGRR